MFKQHKYILLFLVDHTFVYVKVSNQFDLNNKGDFDFSTDLILVKGVDGDVRHYFKEKVTMFKVVEELP